MLLRSEEPTFWLHGSDDNLLDLYHYHCHGRSSSLKEALSVSALAFVSNHGPQAILRRPGMLTAWSQLRDNTPGRSAIVLLTFSSILGRPPSQAPTFRDKTRKAQLEPATFVQNARYTPRSVVKALHSSDCAEDSETSATATCKSSPTKSRSSVAT